MKRRDFIKQSGKIAGGLLSGAIMGSFSGCKLGDLHEFYSYDGTLRNGVSWTNFQMVVDIGSEGTYDVGLALGPTVIKDGDTYKMWYYGGSGFGTIIYCDSPDGINWKNFQLAVFKNAQGVWDTTGVYFPCAIKDGSIYKMWYQGNNGTNRLLYCESSDGINWSNYQKSVDIKSEGTYDKTGTASPVVIKDNSIYKMWYSGKDTGGTWRIIYCESTDGINYNNFQLSINISSHGIYDTSGTRDPIVIKDGSTYKMWYTAQMGTNNRIIYCESPDGINWSNFQLSVNIGSQGIYDTTGTSTPCVINENGVGKMWYSGKTGTKFRILYCESY